MQKSKEEVTWRRNWASAFYLDAEVTAYEIQEELWAFDINDTINGIGGVLGLFLGYSMYHVLSNVYMLIQKLFVRIICKGN